MSSSTTEIFQRVIAPAEGTLPSALATYLLTLDFVEADQKRYEALSEKAQAGTLTADEERELDRYLDVDAMISLLRLKAKRSLKN